MKKERVDSCLPCIGCYGEEDEMCSECDDSKKCKREKEIIMAKITGTKAIAKTKLEFDTKLIEDSETRMDTLSDMSPALLKKVAEHYEIELSGKSKNQMLLDIDNDFESKENVGKEDSEEEVKEEEVGFDAEELAGLIAKATKGNKAKILEVIVEYLSSFEETDEDEEEEEEEDEEVPKSKGKAVAKKPVVEEEDEEEDSDDDEDEDEDSDDDEEEDEDSDDDEEEEEDSDDDEDEEEEVPKSKGKAVAKKPVVEEEDEEEDSDDDEDEEVEEVPKLTISASLLKVISTAGLKQKLSKDNIAITDVKGEILATIKSDGKITYLIPTTVPKGVKLTGKFAGKPAIDVKDVKGITVLISKMS